jgi:YbbR domain-containing protein
MAYHPFRNGGLKLLAVLLASALWFTVAGEHDVERTLRVPLEFRNKPATMEIVGDPPTTVDVRVLGSSAVLSRMEPGDVVAVLDLSTARPGSRLFNMRAENVRSPYGVDVLQVTPSTISLELERSARRMLKVVPAVEGEPAPGFVIGPVTTDPAEVEVVGPESHIRDLTSATTEPVLVAGARAGLEDVVTVGVSDSAVRLAAAQDATVKIQIIPAPVERGLAGVPIRWRNLGDALTARVQPLSVQVVVRGQQAALESMRAETLDAFVDLAGLGPGQYNLRVQFDPTQSFGVSTAEPAVVQVTIK